MAVYAVAERKQPSLAIVTSRASICFSRGAGNTMDATASWERRGWNHAVAKFSLATALPQECNYGFTRAQARLHNSHEADMAESFSRSSALHQHRGLGYSSRFCVSEDNLPTGWRCEKKSSKYAV